MCVVCRAADKKGRLARRKSLFCTRFCDCLNSPAAYDVQRVRLKAFYATNESAWLMGNSQNKSNGSVLRLKVKIERIAFH
jgi:hypothetical protein